MKDLSSDFIHLNIMSQEIIPYIDKNWENLTTVARRVKLTWHNTVYKTLVSLQLFFLKINSIRICTYENVSLYVNVYVLLLCTPT